MVLRSLAFSALFLSASTAALSQAQSADVAFVDRAAALALDETCDLFTDQERQSLEAGLRQASATLMRSGVTQAQLDEELVRARRAAIRADCNHPDVQDAAEHIRMAYTGYMQMRRWTYQGTHQGWTADRNRLLFNGWTLYQDDRGKDARSGWAQTPDAEGVLLTGRSETPITGAVLVLRDTTRARQPHDATAGGLLRPPNGEPLAAFGPPSQAEQRIWATSRMQPPLGEFPVSDNGEPASEAVLASTYSFQFPDDTLDTLAQLDPKEGIKIELTNRNGQRVKTLWFEVGELGAAIDFIEAARRFYNQSN